MERDGWESAKHPCDASVIKNAARVAHFVVGQVFAPNGFFSRNDVVPPPIVPQSRRTMMPPRVWGCVCVPFATKKSKKMQDTSKFDFLELQDCVSNTDDFVIKVTLRLKS